MIRYYSIYYGVNLFGYIYGGLLGLAFGLGIAFFITMLLVKKSNDIGDSKGALYDFGYLNMMYTEDGLHRYAPSGRGAVLLRESHREEKEKMGIKTEEEVVRKEWKDTKNIFQDRYGDV